MNIRDVPDRTMRQLERLARHRRISVQAVALEALVELGQQADNAELLESLDNTGVDQDEIIGAMSVERAVRDEAGGRG